MPATVAAIGSSPASRATVTPDAATLATVPAGTSCIVTFTLPSGNTVDTTALTPSGVWVDTAARVPAIALSPAEGAQTQVTDPQWVTATGSGLNTATAVTFAYCPADNPTATYPALNLKPAANGSSISFQVPNVPASSCAVVITLPKKGSRPAGYTVASVPPSGGFTFLPPYQGAIPVTVTNSATSGIADGDLYLSVMADVSGGGAVGGITGVNGSTLTSAAFTSLPGYDAATHSATLTLTPPVESGNLYFSNASLTGAPPDPATSTIRYGFAEFTYDASGLDVDFTMIDQVGVTMSQVLKDQSQSAIPGSYRDTGCLVDIVNGLSLTGVDMSPYVFDQATGTNTGGVMKYTGTLPTSTPAPGTWTLDDLNDVSDGGSTWIGLVGASKYPTPYPSVETYATSVTGPLTVQDSVGVTSTKKDPQYGNGAFDYTATLSGGVWTLAGTVSGGQPGPTLRVEQAGLYGPGTRGGTGYGLYGQDGPFNVQLPGKAWLGWSNGSALTGTGWTTVTKTIYRDFIAAFSYGYWGSAYGNDTGASGVNFTRNPLTDAYAAAQPTYPTKTGQYAWNVYDDVIRAASNSDYSLPAPGAPKPSGVYAMPYSDTFVPSDLSPNQQQAFAYYWDLTLGDPATCHGPTAVQARLAPTPQTVKVDVGTPITTAVLAEFGFTGPVTYSISPVLPSGLSLDTETGVISGTPVATLSQTAFTITGSDGTTSALARVNLAVGADPTSTPTPVVPTCPPGSWWDPTYQACVEPA